MARVTYYEKQVKRLKGKAANPWATARMIETRHMHKHAEEGWVPSAEAARAARDGLALVTAGLGGRGLRPETILWAKLIAKRARIPYDRLRTMAAWFARHRVDRRRGWSDPPTPGYVAHQLWGGTAAARYVTRAIYQRAYV